MTAEPTETPAAETPTAGGAGRSAEARELERQLEEAKNKLREAEQRADDAEARARENLDRWQRAQADLANYRRRAQFEREEMEKFAVASLAAAILPVLDSFDRAWQTLPGQLRRLTWLSGMFMIDSQLRGTLQRIGVAEIEAEGQPFDPNLHEAIDQEEHEGQPHVVQILQAGYRLHERTLRPALVKVGPKPATPSGGGATDSASSRATMASSEAAAASTGAGGSGGEAPAGVRGEAPDSNPSPSPSEGEGARG